MKLRNRIMSWVLSPGAYAVWHAMGNPEEWEIGRDALTHKSTDLKVTVLDWRNAHKHDVPRPIALALVFLLGTFVLDCEEEYEGAIGYLDRHIIAGRAYRLMKKIHKRDRVQAIRGKRNMEVFTKLTVNQ